MRVCLSVAICVAVISSPAVAHTGLDAPAVDKTIVRSEIQRGKHAVFDLCWGRAPLELSPNASTTCIRRIDEQDRASSRAGQTAFAVGVYFTGWLLLFADSSAPQKTEFEKALTTVFAEEAEKVLRKLRAYQH